jgi:hypothetical protein
MVPVMQNRQMGPMARIRLVAPEDPLRETTPAEVVGWVLATVCLVLFILTSATSTARFEETLAMSVWWALWAVLARRGWRRTRAGYLALGLAAVALTLWLYAMRFQRPEFLMAGLWWAVWMAVAWKDALARRPGRLLYGATVVAACLATVALTSGPFYANGLHLRPEADVYQSLVDVRNHAPFRWEWCGGPLYQSATFLHIAAPIIIGLAATFLGRTLAANWAVVGRRERRWFAVVVGLALAIYVISLKDWWIVGVWLRD